MDELRELEKMVETVQKDIRGDFPEIPEADFGYNLYVEELSDWSNENFGRRRLFGVIDMGDLYTESFVWDDEEGWQLYLYGNAGTGSHDLLRRIERIRSFGSGR